MTAPLPPKPPRDWENITTREAFSYIRTGENGEPTPTPTAPLGTPVVTVPVQNGGDIDVVLAPGEDPLDLGWPVVRYDSRGQNQVRVVSDVRDAGAPDAELFAEYSEDGSSFDTPGAASADVAISLATTGPAPAEDEGWVDLTPAAIADRLWRLQHRGGDEEASPALSGSHLQFRQKTAARPPRGTTPDLPDGAPWGNIVFDIDASGEAMQALAYADGDDVDLWPDETANGNHMTTAAVLLLPKYRASGFNGSRPCVEWAGANVPLSTAFNPTGGNSSYTYYVVLEGLDGGDSGRIWGAGLGDSFEYAYYADGDTVYAANNNLFGAPSAFAEDSGGSAWGMEDAHIYRFVKSTASSTHFIYVDGVLKDSAGAAPQPNNNGTAWLMDYMTGLGITGKVARIVAYDQSHTSPDNSGPVADGLTVPEVALQAFWGRPDA